LIQCNSTGYTMLQLADTNKAGGNSDIIYYVDKLSSKLIECKGSLPVVCEITNTDTSS